VGKAGQAGPAGWILAQEPISNKKFFSFYSHNKIQEHFITPGKICNGMNARNNYLFKYITL
jgi:hypothetical protein